MDRLLVNAPPSNAPGILPPVPAARDPRRGRNSTPGTISIDDLWSSLVGREIERGAWVDGMARDRELREQSETIAARLESQGIPARQKANLISIVGAVTQSASRATDYRNSNLIPFMQSRNVHEMLKHVGYCFDRYEQRQLRMYVISNGWVPLDRYREEHMRFGRLLSRLAAEPWLARYGIELLYFNIENTIQRDSDGRAMLNMHSHVLVRSHRYLGSLRWRELMARVSAYFPKAYAHDEAIESPAECVKYVFKPSEFSALSDAEFAELFRQTHRLKFFHPLGALRRFRRELDLAGLKLTRVPIGDCWVWRTVARDRAPPAAEDASSTSKIIDLMFQPGDPAAREKPDQLDQVLGVTAPMPKFSPRFEPCLIVRNYSGDFQRLLQRESVRELVARARRLWEAQACASRRHTTTTTDGDRHQRLGDMPWSLPDVVAAPA